MVDVMLASPTSRHADIFGDDWATELKMDGRRVVVEIADGEVRPHGRDGLPTYVPQAVAAQLAPLGDCLIDGELIGNDFVAFDLPHLIGMEYRQRREGMERLFSLWKNHPNIHLVPSASSADDKIAMAKKVRERGGEGLVAKRVTSTYTNGRSRDWVKIKQHHTVDCVVLSLGADKQNMVVAVFDGPRTIEFEIGRTVGDGPIAKPGDVIEVRCLYVTDDDRLYQPVAQKIRTDKTPDECTVDQLTGCRPDKTLPITWTSRRNDERS